MSLINDALKRAKESHGKNPPPAAPPEKSGLRLVEPAPRKGMPVWLWPLIIVVLVGLGMFLIGQSTHKTAAATSSMSGENAVQPAKAAPVEPAPVAVAKTSMPEPVKAAVEKPAVAKAPDVAPAAAQAPVVAVATPPVEPVPTFKLQSIIFDPRRPSAMVNGKSLFIGDRIDGFRLTGIRKDSVTLVGGGQTNVLELEN